MIAVDTNILVYAHRRDSAFHEVAHRRVAELAEGRASWAITWPSIHEFIGIVTHPRIWSPPSTLEQAIDQVEAWCASPSLLLLSESAGYWDDFKAILVAGRVTGPRVHDARIAALCHHHAVRTLWTADRDFSRFAALKAHNPLVS